jgi:transposase-like protein
MKRYVAVERVADAFNIGTDTLRSWKSRLRKEFGALDLESGMAQARSEDATATGLFEDRSLNFTAKSYVKKYSKK